MLNINSVKKYSNSISCNAYLKEDVLYINSNKKDYSIAKISFEKINVSEFKEYNFNCNFKSDADYNKFVLNHYDINNKKIKREYIENNKIFTTEEKECYIIIELIISSFDKFEFELKDLNIELKGDRKERKAKIVALHIDTVQDFETTCERNLEKALKGIDNASKVRPDLIVLTECFYDRRVWKCPSETAVTIDSTPIIKLREKAKKYNTYIAFSIKLKEKDKIYNAGILIDRDGSIKGKYYKTHLTMTEKEGGLVPGRELPVFNCDFGKVAFAICWDMWFPLLIREYYKKGVEILINPTAGFPDYDMRSRAIDNGIYIVSSGIMARNKTRIISPLGEVISTAEVNGFAVADIDLSKRNYEYWLSVGDTLGNGKNIYINEERRDLYEV